MTSKEPTRQGDTWSCFRWGDLWYGVSCFRHQGLCTCVFGIASWWIRIHETRKESLNPCFVYFSCSDFEVNELSAWVRRTCRPWRTIKVHHYASKNSLLCEVLDFYQNIWEWGTKWMRYETLQKSRMSILINRPVTNFKHQGWVCVGGNALNTPRRMMKHVLVAWHKGMRLKSPNIWQMHVVRLWCFNPPHSVFQWECTEGE